VFRALLKFIIIVAVILLVGQTKWNGKTVGAQFQKGVKTAWKWGNRKLEDTNILADFTNLSFIKKWVGNDGKSGTRKQKPKNKRAHKKPANPVINENITRADREALLRLLK